jgi:cytidine deaminase
MKELILKSRISECQIDELTDVEKQLVEMAIESTKHSYAPFSHFHVGAALLLENGKMIVGCNQENAVLPAGICAERSAIFSAGAKYPDQAVKILAIAARGTNGEIIEEPVTPCGICRQVIIETETRYQQPIRILLYGKKKIYVMNGIKELMPLSFSEF